MLKGAVGLLIEMWSTILKSTGIPAERVSRDTTSPTAVILVGVFKLIMFFSSSIVLSGSPGMSLPNGSLS